MDNKKTVASDVVRFRCADPFNSRLLRLFAALASVFGALFVRWLLDPLLGNRLAFLTLYGGVTLAVWLAGWRPAVVAAALGFLGADLCFDSPRWTLPTAKATFIPGLAGYALSCGIIIWLGEKMRRATRRAEERGARLEKEMAERNEAEAALRESRERLAGIIESAMDAVIAIDEDQQIILFNPAAETMFGCTADQAVGTPLSRFIPLRYQKAHEQHVRTFGTTGVTRRGMSSLGELVGVRACGAEFPIQASISQLLVNGNKIYTAIVRDMTEHRNAQLELARYREHLESLVDEKTTELQQAMEHLRRSERLVCLGTLAAGIAHEIKNPLNSLLLLADYGLNESVAESSDTFAQIKTEAMRMGKVVTNLLSFARSHTLEKEMADMNDIVRHVRDLLGSQMQLDRTSLQLDLAPDLPMLRLNRTEMEQVLINLVRNAVEASDRPVSLTMRTWCQDGSVALTVSDDGPGISEEIQARIFEPLFSTKNATGGTGLGLSLCRTIVTDHGGTISVSSRMGAGSTFTIRIPCRPASLAPAAPSGESLQVRG